MALQKSLTFSNEITLSTAYIVIHKIEISYITSEVTVYVSIYKDSTAYSNSSPEVQNLNHVCSGSDFTTYFSESVLDDAGETLLTKAYDWLLSLSIYTGATEV